MKRLIVAPRSTSEMVIAIPPSKMATISLKPTNISGKTVELSEWVKKQMAVSSLESAGISPWHIVISYDQFDEDGDNIHSGVFEEFWIAPNKYQRIYKSDTLNQTDYGTEKGLFRQGDQNWPDRAQLQVRKEVLDPYAYAATLRGFRTRIADRTFDGYALQCATAENEIGISDTKLFCYEPNTSTLRYSRGEGWYQTVYNQFESFGGREIARQIDVTDGGDPYLKLRVDVLEIIDNVNLADFAPSPDARGLLGDRVKGVLVHPTKTVPAEFPASLGKNPPTVAVTIIIGKDGRVISARAISGPAAAYKACEAAARKWVFTPYLVAGNPVEVEMNIEFTRASM